MLSLLTLLCFSCSPDDSLGPDPHKRDPASPNLASVPDSVCARLTANITSASAVTVTYPNAASCVGGYVLIKGANATWSQSGGRTLTLKLRVRNRSTVAQPSPVRITLPLTGVRVLTPNGTPATTVAATNADSTLADGSKLWRFGATGQLAAGDSTVVKTLTFTVQAPTTKVQLTFQTPADTSRPAIPNAPLPVGSQSKTVLAPGSGINGEYYRTVFYVKFRSGTSGVTIRDVFTRYQATIIGGVQAIENYAISVPDPGPTWAAYSDLRNRLRAEPSVEYVVALEVRPNVRPTGRYPDDGAGFTRSAWLTPTDATWQWHAIRAPLAWGCEIGTYGPTSSLIPVAVLESYFSPSLSHADLDQSVAGLPITYPDVPDTAFFYDSYTRDALATHAISVSGQITAQGGNGNGLAGVLWRSKLTRMSLTDEGGHLPNIAHVIANTVRTTLKQRGVRILNISTEWVRVNEDSIQVRDLSSQTLSAFQAVLDSVPDLMIVQAIGNAGFTLSVQDTVKLDSLGYLHFALAHLKTRPAYTDRIIFVGGVDRNNQRVGASNFINGLTDIAAPADSMALLNLPGAQAPFGAFPFWDKGTSFGTPMVAGVAAALIAMDPMITLSQIRDYLIRGAQVKRINPVTGDSVAPSPVGGAPEAIYQLDAYGALALLSRERNAPVCGFPASVDGQDVVLERNAPTRIPMTGGVTPLSLSVAQGGRRLAVVVDTGGPVPWVHEFGFQGGSWTLIRNMPTTVRRGYLERDTVDVTVNTNFDERYTLRRASGTTTSNMNLLQVAEPTATHSIAGYAVFSPHSDYAVMTGYYIFGQGCHQLLGHRTHLVRLPTGPVTVLYDDVHDECVAPAGQTNGWDATWSSDGQRFAIGIPQASWDPVLRSRFLQGTLAGTTLTLVSDFIINDLYVRPWGYTSGAELIYSEEWGPDPTSSECSQVARLATNPSTVARVLRPGCGRGTMSNLIARVTSPLRSTPGGAMSGPVPEQHRRFEVRARRVQAN